MQHSAKLPVSSPALLVLRMVQFHVSKCCFHFFSSSSNIFTLSYTPESHCFEKLGDYLWRMTYMSVIYLSCLFSYGSAWLISEHSFFCFVCWLIFGFCWTKGMHWTQVLVELRASFFSNSLHFPFLTFNFIKIIYLPQFRGKTLIDFYAWCSLLGRTSEHSVWTLERWTLLPNLVQLTFSLIHSEPSG